MEAILFVTKYTGYLMILAVGMGSLSGGIYAIKMITSDSEDEVVKCKKSIKTIIIGVVMALTIGTLIIFVHDLI